MMLFLVLSFYVNIPPSLPSTPNPNNKLQNTEEKKTKLILGLNWLCGRKEKPKGLLTQC
jgi:hypothetical protein